jgi:hypothetical protein
MRNFRIKEWESFSVQDDRYYIHAILINVKYYRAAQVFVYDWETKELLLKVRKILPFSGWQLPRRLSNASIESRSYGFFFRIHTWLDANIIRVDLNIQARRKRPSFTAHLSFNFAKKATTPMAVNLLFSERRSLYTFKALTAVRGNIAVGTRIISLDSKKTSGLFCDYKGFYPYRMVSVWCTGFGITADNVRVGFSITENQTKESHKNNENALWVEEELTPLPPIRITMPNGIESDWVIQDLEGMVDLTFTPQKEALRGLHSYINLILSKVDFNTPLGYYNGMLVNSRGEQIPVHNMPGLGEKLYLRV